MWEPRYLAYPGGLALPRVLADVSALIAGGYRRIFLKSAGPPAGVDPGGARFRRRRRRDHGAAAATVKSRVNSAGPLPIFTLQV